ncbi:MAG: gamma-butyrobetaine hydroxylase-like domain-containing protein [Hyphomonadaceae bacterium]|nr:gamma-butyrobetaine hydroxylase-like domain-containing protein [Hyphomonadaceae bacterium]
MSKAPWPTELTFKSDDKRLAISFDDGAKFEIPFELLRVESPSAEVRGHGAGPLPAIAGKENVAVTEALPVGRYAVRIGFDDGHNTGLYSWEFLYELGRDAKARMAAHKQRIGSR